MLAEERVGAEAQLRQVERLGHPPRGPSGERIGLRPVDDRVPVGTPARRVPRVEPRLAKLRQAQADGRLTDRWDATAILVFVVSIANAWATLNPEFSATSAPDRDARRRAVTEAVARLIAPD